MDIYRDIHLSLDLLMERTLPLETVTQENAKVLPRFAAVEQHARVCSLAPDRPSKLRGDARNDLDEDVDCRLSSTLALSTAGRLTGTQAPGNSHGDDTCGAPPLPYSEQAFTVPRPGNSLCCRDNHHEDVETAASSESNTSFTSSRNVRGQLDPSISALARENGSQSL